MERSFELQNFTDGVFLFLMFALMPNPGVVETQPEVEQTGKQQGIPSVGQPGAARLDLEQLRLRTYEHEPVQLQLQVLTNAPPAK